MRMRAKQKRLAANQTHAPPSENKLAAALAAQDVPSAAPVIPIDPDEDLGEALDPATPAPEAALATVAAVTPHLAHNNSASPNAKVDPETQALLAQSRKQINAISQ